MSKITINTLTDARNLAERAYDEAAAAAKAKRAEYWAARDVEDEACIASVKCEYSSGDWHAMRAAYHAAADAANAIYQEMVSASVAESNAQKEYRKAAQALDQALDLVSG